MRKFKPEGNKFTSWGNQNIRFDMRKFYIAIYFFKYQTKSKALYKLNTSSINRYYIKKTVFILMSTRFLYHKLKKHINSNVPTREIS